MEAKGCCFAAEDPRGRSARLIQKDRITQHQFKSRRRYEAIEKRETELANAKATNTWLKLEVAYLQQRLQHWDAWWDSFQQSSARDADILSQELSPQLGNDPFTGTDAATTFENAAQHCCDPPRTVSEQLEAEGSEWCEHIVWTTPSSGTPKEKSSNEVVNVNKRVNEAADEECTLVGAPAALDTALIYSDEEISGICDALVGPLARELQLFDNMTDFPLRLASDGAKHCLGKLLRDVCTKVVPLTSELQTRRNVIEKALASRAMRNQNADARNDSKTSAQQVPIGVAIGRRVRLNDPDLMPKYRNKVATVTAWSSSVNKWVVQWPETDNHTQSFYSTMELEELGSFL